MHEQLYDKLMQYYYDNHDEKYQAEIPFADWLNSMTNMALIKVIDEVGGC